MATRPLDLSPERASRGEGLRHRQREIMRERGKKNKDRKSGEEGDKEVKRSGERKERGRGEKRVRSCSDFWGTALGGAAIIYTACKSVSF